MTASAPSRRQQLSTLSQRVGAAARPVRDALRADPTTNPVVLALTRVLGLLALAALWLLVFGIGLSSLVYSHHQHGLYSDFRQQLESGTAPLGGAIAEGKPVALITAGSVGLHDVVVVEGSSSRDLESGPGHRPGTPLPGQPGASVVLGRATSFGAPFADITKLTQGQTIMVTTGEGKFSYIVADVRYPGDPLPAQLPTGGSQLTLVTAAGTGWRSGWAPSAPVYVDALLKGKSVAAPAQGSVAFTRDGVLKRDTRGLYPLVLWLQVILVAAIGGVWVRGRWGLARAWLLAAPIGAAGLWGASLTLWLLLPNLL